MGAGDIAAMDRFLARCSRRPSAAQTPSSNFHSRHFMAMLAPQGVTMLNLNSQEVGARLS